MAAAFGLSIAVFGCHQLESNAMTRAQAFRSEAERCLQSVRDDRLAYEKSSSCKQLEAKHKAYIEARDLRSKVPFEEQFVMESGFRMAWAARATSAIGNPSLSLWVD